MINSLITRMLVNKEIADDDMADQVSPYTTLWDTTRELCKMKKVVKTVYQSFPLRSLSLVSI